LKAKVLIHLAGISNPNEILVDERRAQDVNYRWPLRLMDQFVAAGGETFVFVSSSHVYGSRPYGVACIESGELNPVSRYGELKVEAELALTSRAEQHGINFMAIRTFSVFGDGMAGHYLASRVKRVLDGVERPSIVQNSADIRDFSTPFQVAKQLEALAYKCHREISNGVINLGSGSGTSISARILQAAPFWPTDMFDGEVSQVPFLVADVRRLQSL